MATGELVSALVPPVCIGFDISPDRRRASVAIGGRRMDGKLHHDGVGWLLERLKQLVEDQAPRAGMRAVRRRRRAGEGRHLGDQVLLDAIRGATTSSSGADAWVFSRRSSRIDIPACTRRCSR